VEAGPLPAVEGGILPTGKIANVVMSLGFYLGILRRADSSAGLEARFCVSQDG
jgi:hypothetical protein